MKARDVNLNPPRYGFRRIRPPLLSQQVTDTLFPAPEIKRRYMAKGKPVPRKFNTKSLEISRRNHLRFQEEMAEGKPSFRVGAHKVYFPYGRICLLPPNPKLTPYQAKFLVPKAMNKMDLRDYLWHLYGLRVLNVNSQLFHGKFTRGGFDYARHRVPQLKKMTVDMLEPFIWPETPASLIREAESVAEGQAKTMERKSSLGSDAAKPNEAFDGLYARPKLPDAFIPKKMQVAGKSLLKDEEELSRLLEMKQQAAKKLGFLDC